MSAVAQVLRGQEAFNRGDFADVVEIVTPDVEWGSTGVWPGVEIDNPGSEGFLSWAEMIRSEWEEFRVTMGEVLHESDDLAVVEEQLRGRGRTSGAEVEMSVYSVYRIDASGRIRKRESFPDREAAKEAAGL